MKAFASWSGGKDCMLATHRHLQEAGNQIVCLVNMCDQKGDLSRSHGLKKQLIQRQANAMGIPVIQQATSHQEYEKNFKNVILKLKEQGVDYGVFGDIYLKEHRVWIERVCSEMDIEPIFPLWNNDTLDLLKEFIHTGFKAITVSVRSEKLSEQWLGRIVDERFLTDISKMENIDPCAENGEYHTFVYDGPLFKTPVNFETGMTVFRDLHHFLELI